MTLSNSVAVSNTRPTKARTPTIVPAVDRAMRILEILKDRPDGCGVVELADMLGASKGTISEMLQTLELHNAVRRNEATKKYGLGFAMLEYGRVVLDSIDLRQIIRPHLVALMKLTGATVYTKTLDGASTVIVDRVVPNTRLQVNEIIGRRDPAAAGAGGRAILAFLDEVALDKILSQGLIRFSDKSIVDKEDYKTALDRVREAGYAIDDEEIVPGVRAISAPIRNHRGQVIASLSVAGSSHLLSDEHMPDVIRQTVQAASEVSAKLNALGLNGSRFV